MGAIGDTLRAHALAWREREPDAAFVRRIDELLVGDDAALLGEYFADSLSFGTAGLRGSVGWGSGCVNEAMIARVSWALGRFLLAEQTVTPASKLWPPLVVVGYDARPESGGFANLAAEILSGLGVSVLCASEPVPTPLVAFLVREEGAAAGVVVTASHNPRGDNGFKVYDGQGVQIVSPWDEEIARLMDIFPPWKSLARTRHHVQSIRPKHYESYVEYVDTLARRLSPGNGEFAASIAYTPLHGVAGPWIYRVIERGSPSLVLKAVPEQLSPDGTFPTTPFPNPEEKGTLDLLLQLAEEQDCSLAIANDPDADRLAVCIRGERDELFQLTGDALGLLLADLCLSLRAPRRPVVVSTIVSSPALDRLAELRGADVRRTLTGFKWLCRAALDEPEFAFAYEEALGYCFAPPPGFCGVMDKDGIAAAAIMGRMLVNSGSRTALFERLLSIYEQIGLWCSQGTSQRFLSDIERTAQQKMEAFMSMLRSFGPKLCDQWRIDATEDFIDGAQGRSQYLGQQDLIRYELSRTAFAVGEPDYAQVLVRPSGTEPKLKVYVHLRCVFNAARVYSLQYSELQLFATKLAANFFSIA